MVNPSKYSKPSPLYVSRQLISYEKLIQHCLWKIILETGLVYLDGLTEMESVCLSNLVKARVSISVQSLTGSESHQTDILNSAIDKIVCEIKSMQVKSQRYDAVVKENLKLKKGVSGHAKLVEASTAAKLEIARKITELGLSRRTVKALQSANIQSLDDLRNCCVSRLKSIERIGVKTIHEIENVLAKYMLHDSSAR